MTSVCTVRRLRGAGPLEWAGFGQRRQVFRQSLSLHAGMASSLLKVTGLLGGLG